MNNIEYNLELWKSYVNKIGEMIFNENYSIYNIFREDKSNFEKFANIYNNNFFKYQSENRFPIPIIGKINSGKSTFLNSILQGNYLTNSFEINTKFICLIRNNKNLKYPQFYKCELNKQKIQNKLKSYEYYYFQKTDHIEWDILQSIKKINDDLKRYEKKVEINKREINKYFYILEINNPLFNSKEDLGNYFDLMDIPGLNEKDDFYLTKIIPILLDKCLFSIYIFDLEHYENEDTLTIYKKYSLQLNKYYNTNSIYILNKIDSISEEDKKNKKDEDYHFNKFKNFLGKSSNNNNSDKEEFNVDLKNNFFLKLNSQELFNKVNAFSNLKFYILYIIGNIKEEEVDESFSLLNYIKQTIIDYFNLDEEEVEIIINDTDENKYKKYYKEEEIKEIENNIINKGLSIDFEETLFAKFKYILKNKKKIRLPIDDLKKVYEIILSSMEKSLEKFFDWNNVLELFTTFKQSINNIFVKEDERKKYIEICDNLLESFNKEMDWKYKLKETNKWKIDIIDPLKMIIDSLINLDSKNDSLKQLKNNFQSLTYFIYNYRKIRIPLIGGYSTGKSSFLNNLIGKDILPVDINACTNRGIIIRHNNNNYPQLFKTKFTPVKNPDYWYFKDEDNPICEGYEEIKRKLIELNSEKVKFEDAFVVVKVPLKLFSELDCSQNNMIKIFEDKLELIDFPGLDVKNNYYKEKIFSPLMRFSDGFIFVNECDLIEECGNLKILTNIINEIKVRKFSFSYTSCFFLLHKLDKSLNLNIEKAKETYEKLFFKDKNKRENFNVNKFSSKLYRIYREFVNKYIKDFESFIKYIIEKLLKSEDKKKIINYQGFLKIINTITNRLKFQINKKLINKIDYKKEYNLNSINEILYNSFKSLKLESNINENKNNDVSQIAQEIYSNYLYINNNYKFQNQRILSNANGLFESLSKLFEDSYFYTEKQFRDYFDAFIANFTNLFIMIDLKIYGTQLNQQLIFNEIENNNNYCKVKANEIYEKYLDLINNQQIILKTKNQQLINDFFSNYNENNNNYKIMEKIEEKIHNNIDEFTNIIKNKILNPLNQIIQYLKYNNNKINKININKVIYNLCSLDKNLRTTEEYICHYDDTFSNIFREIGNFFISIYNASHQKEKIKLNFDDYLNKINYLIEKYKETCINTIESRKDEIFNTIKYNLWNNNYNFSKIIERRNEYEKIKEEYFKIIK